MYRLGISVVAIWNEKAKDWITGRKDILNQIATALNQKDRNRTIWMHCASLGEFEQGRPLLEQIRAKDSSACIIITFFSPSGYRIRKNYPGADFVFYLPMDGKHNARELVRLFNPSLVLWIKYEFWHYYLEELKRRQVPAYLVSGAFRKGQRFFTSYGSFWKNILKSFTHIFLQNHLSAQLLEEIGISGNVTVSGDTRFDRVISIAENHVPIPAIAQFCSSRQVIVAGSTWEEDEAVFIHYVRANPGKAFIIAPHEIDIENLTEIKKAFPGSIFFSEVGNISSVQDYHKINVLIIDSIGLLAGLYKYADVTYVGGGFGDDGLHNILEAAVYGKPVVFGSEIDKNFEATELIDAGGAVCIENAVELEAAMNEMLNNEVELKLKGDAARAYIYSKAGATKIVMDYLFLPPGR